METLKNIFKQYIVPYGLKILLSLAVFIIGIIIVKFVIRALKKGKKFKNLSLHVQNTIILVVRIVLITILLLSCVEILGINVTTIMALIGSSGLAIGLAFQGSLSNLAGGLMLLIFRPFVLGDYIITEHYEGNVTDIGLFYTKLKTVDNKVVNIPNAIISNTSVINTTAFKVRRMDLEISVPYSADIDVVRKVLLDVVDAHPKTEKEPEPQFHMSSHNDSSVSCLLQIWIKKENFKKEGDYRNIKFDILENSKKKLEENGIFIPFPQLDVHIIDKEK